MPFMLPTGSQASSKKHQLNLKHIKGVHQDTSRSNALQRTRIGALEKMLNKKPSALNGKDNKYLTRKSWALLKELKLEKQVIQTWINEGFWKSETGHHDHGGGCCGHHHSPKAAPGMKNKAANWSSFNFEDFIKQADPAALKSFNSAIDYFIFYQHEKTLRYQQYGLNDFFWQLKRQGL